MHWSVNLTLQAVLAVGSGVLLATGWLAHEWIWPPWLGLIGQMLLTHADRPRRALVWCLVVGTTTHLLAFSWVPDTVTRFSTLPGGLPWVIYVLACTFGGLQTAVFGWAVCRLRRGGALPAYVPAALWVSLELLWPMIFPWRYGQTQLEWSALIQVAELTGVYGVSFLMVWLAGLVADVLRYVVLERRRDGAPPAVGHALLAVTAFALTIVYGIWRADDIKCQMEQNADVTFGLVQAGDNDRLANLKRQSAAAGHVDVLCWPESSIGRLPAGMETLPPRYRLPQDSVGHLVLGSSTPPAEGQDRWWVSAVLVDGHMRVLDRYHKRALIPFGEYIPGERWFPKLSELTVFNLLYRAGDSPAPLQIPGGPQLGMLICYEDTAAELARASTAAGATVLVNLTNDRWFGKSAALTQHLQLARWRTIENRRYLVRSTLTGVSAIVDPLGAVVARAPTQEPAFLVHPIQSLTITTVYTRYGDAFAWGCVLLIAVLLIRRRITRVPESPPATQSATDQPS